MISYNKQIWSFDKRNSNHEINSYRQLYTWKRKIQNANAAKLIQFKKLEKLPQKD